MTGDEDDRGLTRRALLGATSFGLGCTGVGCLGNLGGDEGSDSTRQREADAAGSSPPDTSEMSRSFADEFRRGEVDTSRWRTKYPWNSRTHNHDGYAAEENVYVEDEKLVLKAEDNPRSGKPYTTGVVSAKDEFRYGYVEGRIKVPPMVHGFWPAFWLTTVNEWPPEIDIFEFFGNESKVWMTYHYEEDGEETKVRDSHEGTDFDDEFHRYGVEWRPDRIVWYVDGKEQFRYEGEHIRGERMYLILNFGIGGVDFLAKPREKDLPATYEIDWVRVWQ